MGHGVDARRIMYHIAPTEARRSIEGHGLDWRRLGLGGAYRPLGDYLWDSFEFALWYAQAAYDDYDIWAVSVEGLQLPADPGVRRVRRRRRALVLLAAAVCAA